MVGADVDADHADGHQHPAGDEHEPSVAFGEWDRAGGEHEAAEAEGDGSQASAQWGVVLAGLHPECEDQKEALERNAECQLDREAGAVGERAKALDA